MLELPDNELLISGDINSNLTSQLIKFDKFMQVKEFISTERQILSLQIM